MLRDLNRLDRDLERDGMKIISLGKWGSKLNTTDCFWLIGKRGCKLNTADCLWLIRKQGRELNTTDCDYITNNAIISRFRWIFLYWKKKKKQVSLKKRKKSNFNFRQPVPYSWLECLPTVTARSWNAKKLIT